MVNKTAANPNDRPDAPGLANQRQAAAVEICRDVYGGTLRMRECRTRYLPQFPREDDDRYRERLQASTLFNAYRRTIKGLAGLVFRKDPQLGDDVPRQIRGDDAGGGGLAAHAENIDLAGRHLVAFARDWFEEALIDGHADVLVDWYDGGVGPAATLDDERQAGSRPFWVLIRKQDVVRFRTRRDGGVPVLEEYAYRTITTKRDGLYGEREVKQIRIYRLAAVPGEREGEQVEGVTYEVWEEPGEGQTDWQQVTRPTPMLRKRRPLRRIPVATCYANRVAFMESAPPLLDLALENVKHWQLTSDQDNVLHKTCVPLLVFSGVDVDSEIVISPNGATKLPQGGEAKWVEVEGKALDKVEKRIEKTERRMAVEGLSQLQSDTRQAETAESKKIDKAESDSQLAASARGLQDAIEEALGYHAWWLDEADGGSCEVNRDFQAIELDAAMIRELGDLVETRKLSLDSLLRALRDGVPLLAFINPEQEIDAIQHGEERGMEPDEFSRRLAALEARMAPGDDPGEGDEPETDRRAA